MFQIRPRLWATAVMVVAATAVGLGSGSTASAGCQVTNSQSAEKGKFGSSAGRKCPNAPAPKLAPKKIDYCKNAGGDEYPDLAFSAKSEPKEMYRYADGRQDTYNLNRYAVETKEKRVESTDDPMISKELVNTGDAPAYERIRIYCTATPPGATEEVILKDQEVWIPVMTPEGVLERHSLFAEVLAGLTDPTVDFVDADAEHGWLWVQVPHTTKIATPRAFTKTKTDRDPTGWGDPVEVVASITATPVAFSVHIQSDAGEKLLGSCDFATVTAGKTCKIQFNHSSSIAKDGKFHGYASVEWQITSNAGTFDGVGPITSTSGFSIEVAEAMAVSNG